jgi:Zn-dependent protease with chaperone function
MKRLTLVLAAFAFALSANPSRADAPQSQALSLVAEQGSPISTAEPTSAPRVASQESPQKITAYTLAPDRYQKARELSRTYFRFRIIGFIYGLVVLWLILRWKLAPKYRDWAERSSSRRVLQAMLFSPLLILTVAVLELPTGIYENWVSRKYGISVQGWTSWSLDWGKRELVSVIVGTIFVMILYAVIRSSPRRWWFYFWLVSLPIALFMVFLQPLVIDPLFHKFEPLEAKDPALTAALEQMVHRAGEDIPRERIFWMGAAEKSTALNAYVTGIGGSKRIVVWDTTIAKMTTPQIVFVAGHETGHYVLYHIPKLLAFGAAILFVVFYVGYRCVGWMLARWGGVWGIRGIDDWASLPALLLLLTILVFVLNPVTNGVSRHYEHQADQYGLEVTHGLTPDSGQVAAQAFQALGEVDLADPEPSRLEVFMFYDHPAIPDRIRFSLSYDPWSKSGQGEFVH